MVVLAALGVAMVSLTSTSMFTGVSANSSARAYYLAESGYRYAESLYLNPPSGTVDDALNSLHDKTFSLAGNTGRFNLKIYPYYLKVDPAVTAGTATGQIRTRVVGAVPGDMSFSSGRLKIGPKAGTIYSYTSAGTSVSGGQTFVTFSGVTPQPFPYFTLNADVLPVARSISSSQTINVGDALLLEAGTAAAFPRCNGTFQVDNHLFAYRVNDLDNSRLLHITDPGAAPMAPLTVAAGSDIILQKFVKLDATGIVGQGDGEGDASREVVYNVPLPRTEEQRREFRETFQDLSNWETPSLGTFALDIGRSALRVTGTSSVSGMITGSLIPFKPSASNIDLAAAHLYGDPYFLSYDAQVKVGFVPEPAPVGGFEPSPVPKYFTAGLSFRLDNDRNSYGLSFLRGGSSDTAADDKIDNGMVPLDHKTMIVLWQATGSGSNFKWLAYKKDLAPLFIDDFESGAHVWTITDLDSSPPNLWHQSSRRSHSSTQAWYYGREDTGTYDTGSRNGGSLVSPDIDLSQATSATLTFWTWIYTEPGGGTDHDQKSVQVSTDGGLNWANLSGSPIPDDNRTWHQRAFDLSTYRGQTINIRFLFDTVDATGNSYEGWYIDDVRIAGDTAAAVNDATLTVRVKEAASISFTNGSYGTGSIPIENSDTILGQTSGARAVVSGAPIISSGSWASGTAAGTLLLENTSGTFSAGEQVYVNSSSAAATVGEFRPRDNFIWAYYGTAGGYGTPDSSAFDDEKKANPRGSVNWPPDELDEWTADSDYYRLVQWDAVNSGVTVISSTTAPNAIIRDNTLTSPTSGSLQQPELGLHTFGRGSNNVYFDDFAVQSDIGSLNTGFLRAVQQ